jgi:transcriptional regulator with XRE-family HTH domain
MSRFIQLKMNKKSPIADQYVAALAAALEQRRRHMGISQDELAEKAGLHRTYVSLIERKSCNFSIKIFMRLALALETNPAELMRAAEDMAVKGRVKTGSETASSDSRHDSQPRPKATG